MVDIPPVVRLIQDSRVDVTCRTQSGAASARVALELSSQRSGSSSGEMMMACGRGAAASSRAHRAPQRTVRFFFYPSDDGEPAHVHEERDRLRAKIWMTPIR